MNNMTIEEKISYVSTRHMLTIKQWDDDYRHYRVGINWDYKTGDVEFLIERPTLEMALDDVIEVINVGYKKWVINNEKRTFNFMRNVKEYLDLSVDSVKNSIRLAELEISMSERDVLPKENIVEYLDKYKTYHSFQEANQCLS